MKPDQFFTKRSQITLGAVLGACLIWLAALNFKSFGVGEEALAVKDLLAAYKEKEEIRLTDFGAFLAKLHIPQQTISLFSSLAIKTPDFSTDIPQDFPVGFVVRGSVLFQGHEVKGKLIVVDDAQGKREMSFSVEFPDNWKISSMIPDYRALDKFSLPSGHIIASSFEYDEPELELVVKAGLNFIAGLELKGPFETVQTLLNKAAKYITVEGDKAYFQGFVPSDIREGAFKAVIPFRLGVDFDQLYREGKLKVQPKIIKKIAIGDLSAEISPYQTEFSIETGILAWLSTQPEPLEFKARAGLTPFKALFAGYSTAPYKQAFGVPAFDLTNLGMEIEMDYTIESIIAWLGIPLTGLGFEGKFSITDTPIEVAGKIAVSADVREMADIVLVGKIGRVDFSKIAQLLAKMVGKPVPINSIPVMVLKSGEIYIAPTRTTIANKVYPEGFKFVADWQMFNDFMGKIDLEVGAKELSIKGIGWLKGIDTPVIKLTGVGPDKKMGTGDDGITIELDISPEKQNVYGSADIEIPPLKVKAAAELTVNYTNFTAHTVFKVANKFSSDTSIVINPTNREAFEAKFEFEQDFGDYIQKQLPGIIEGLRVKAQNDVNQYDQKLQGFQRQIDDAKRDQDNINQLNKEIKRLEGQCGITNPGACAKLAEKKGSQILKKSASGLLNIISQATGELGRFQGLKQAAQSTVNAAAAVAGAASQAVTIITIKKASGEIKGLDLKAGKLPKLNELIIDINIPGKTKKTVSIRDIQFDFTNPENSIQPIATVIFDNTKGMF